MSEKILVPVLGESIAEATVSKWLKKVGDQVEVDYAIVELETDKVNLEVPSPISGMLSEINSKDGDTVEVGAVLGSVSGGKLKIEKNESPKQEISAGTISEESEKEENTNVINLDVDKKSKKKIKPKMVSKVITFIFNNSFCNRSNEFIAKHSSNRSS